jgi:hypothetical protein
LIEQGAEGVRERERGVGSHERNTTPIPAVEAEKKTVTINRVSFPKNMRDDETEMVEQEMV